MKITLILPAGPIHRYKTGNFDKVLRYAPLTLTSLASMIPADVEPEITIIDDGVEILPGKYDADIVGISIMTGTSIRGYKIANKIRKSGIPVIMGGVHCTLMPEEAALHADAVVSGFGEDVFSELLHDFKSGKMKKFYKGDNDRVDLANRPWPRRDLLKKGAYITKNSIQAVRGCPNECEFCVIPVAWGKKSYYRPVGDVIRELEMFSGKIVTFVDPSPIEKPEYSKELYRAMIPLKKWWGGLATIKIAEDDELLDLAVKSGCKGLLIGFESVTQETLNSMHKTFNNANKFVEIVKKLHDKGLGIQGTFVFGFETDDTDVFKRTVDFVNKVKIDLPRFSAYTPFPGTPTYKNLDSQGRLLSKNWLLYDAQHVVFKPAKMSPEQLQEGLWWAWKQAYSPGSIVHRLFLRNRIEPVVMLPLNLGYRHYAMTLHEYNQVMYDREAGMELT